MKRLLALALAAALAPFALAAVNVNTATVEELQTLRDIGPVQARAIVDYREKHGPFHSLDDLDKVPGIGKPTLASLRKEVTFSGADEGLPALRKDNRAEDRTDARAQRGYTK
jgi:competence protein ComEA